RRHTRFSRDWSSDVCSSDLAVALGVATPEAESAARDRIVPGHVWVEAVGFWTPGYPHLRALLAGTADPELRRPPAALLPARARGDRKSVVAGESVDPAGPTA